MAQSTTSAGTWEISKTISFEASHALPHLAPEHQCSRLHGHGYVVQVTVASRELVDGWVLDFGLLSRLVRDRFDHRDLNALCDFPTTAENLAAHIAALVQHAANDLPNRPRVIAVTVNETASSAATFRPSAPGNEASHG